MMRAVLRRILIGLAVAALALLITAVSPATDSAVRVQVHAAGISKTTSRRISMGDRVTAFAMRFRGNPYKYGGTSLTKGADCSGFVMQIYRHFGVRLPRTSRAMRKAGFKVRSLRKAAPGDILCYKGHVAIYLGRNYIIHASSPKKGICVGKNARYKKIITIRRIFK